MHWKSAEQFLIWSFLLSQNFFWNSQQKRMMYPNQIKEKEKSSYLQKKISFFFLSAAAAQSEILTNKGSSQITSMILPNNSTFWPFKEGLEHEIKLDFSKSLEKSQSRIWVVFQYTWLNDWKINLRFGKNSKILWHFNYWGFKAAL